MTTEQADILLKILGEMKWMLMAIQISVTVACGVYFLRYVQKD